MPLTFYLPLTLNPKEPAMKKARPWIKLLLWMHLFVCLVWLCLFQMERNPPGWMLHVFVWSILAIQFTWGFTVGLMVGPSRRRRWMLWSSLLTLFMPLYFVSFLFRILVYAVGLPLALLYLAIFVMILASETFCGVLLGAKLHGGNGDME